MTRRLWHLGLAPLLVACGGAGAAPPPPAAPVDTHADEQRFDALEEEILRDLATLDRRVALRGRITLRDEDLRRVGMAAVLSEDPSIVLVEGSIDPFSFDARTRGIAAVRAKLAKLLPAPRPGRDKPALERTLLARLVDEESLRLDEEKAMPRSASALVRALIETWRAPTSAAEAEERDRGLSRRLRELRESLGSGLDVPRARELDDALDALEHLVDTPGFRASTAELVKVREALEGGPKMPRAGGSTWQELAPKLRVHLGVEGDPAALEKRLALAEARARALAAPPLEKSGLARDALSGRLEPLLFGEGPCVEAIPGSRVRSMAAPPEREPACRLVHALATAQDDTARAVALAALHDHVVVALWAVQTARGDTPERAAQRTHLFAPPSAPLAARLERIALARPVAAIGAGLAAELLLQDEGDPRARAASWAALGDVPLDEARALLGEK